MTTSIQNSESDKLPKAIPPSPVNGSSAPTHVSNAGEALTESGKSKAASSTSLPQQGSRIRDYEFIQLLGQGGMVRCGRLGIRG